MRFPFVSRGRLDDAQATIAELKADNKRLLEMLLPGMRPVQPGAPAAPDIGTMSPGELAAVMPMGRPTIASVQFDANKAAADRAEKGGTPLSIEVREKAMKPWRQFSEKAVGNGG